MLSNTQYSVIVKRTIQATACGETYRTTLDRLQCCTTSTCNTYHATLAKFKLTFLPRLTGKPVKICSLSAVNTASGSSTRVPSHLY